MTIRNLFLKSNTHKKHDILKYKLNKTALAAVAQ